MARPKKTDPELLLVSFCDILTISISGLFMATIITVFESTKVPELKMTPKAETTDKAAVFFECRNDQLFYVDKLAIDEQVTKLLSSLPANVKSGDLKGFLKAIQGQEMGNEYYTVNPNYLLTAIVALEARPGVKGETMAQIENAKGKFANILATRLRADKQYIVFLVRDDSFDIFRKARVYADLVGFDTGWELLSSTDPIKFGAGGAAILKQ
jgi:hypothetical protein